MDAVPRGDGVGGKHDVLPLDNRSIADLVRDMPVMDTPEGGVYRYYPGTLPLPELNAAEICGRSFKILARVDLERDFKAGLARD